MREGGVLEYNKLVDLTWQICYYSNHINLPYSCESHYRESLDHDNYWLLDILYLSMMSSPFLLSDISPSSWLSWAGILHTPRIPRRPRKYPSFLSSSYLEFLSKLSVNYLTSYCSGLKSKSSESILFDLVNFLLFSTFIFYYKTFEVKFKDFRNAQTLILHFSRNLVWVSSSWVKTRGLRISTKSLHLSRTFLTVRRCLGVCVSVFVMLRVLSSYFSFPSCFFSIFPTLSSSSPLL